MAFDGTLKFGTSIDKSGFESGLSALGSLAQKGMALVASAVKLGADAVKTLGTSAIETGRSFEAGMSQIQATLGISVTDLQNNVNGAADTMNALTAKAEEMGRKTAFSATQAAEGLNILAMSGYDAESSIGMIENVLNMASAGGLELSQAASYVAGSMKGFTAEAELFADTTEASSYYANMIAKGATLAATDVNQLGAALSQASATANTYGQTSQSTAAALLRLAEQNVVGEAAATSLAAAMKNLYSPTDSAKKALSELGVSAYDAQGKARDFNEVVDDLYGALSQISDQSVRADLENVIFGIQGQAAFDKMVASSGEKVQQFYDGLAGANGAAASMENLGIAVHDAGGNLRSTADIAADLRKALDNMTPEEQTSAIRQIFNTDDFEYVDSLLNDTSGEFEAFSAVIANSMGSAELQANAMLDNLSGDLTLFQSAAEGFYNALYKGMNDSLREVVQLGNSYVSELTEVLEADGLDGAAVKLGSILADAATRLTERLPEFIDIGLKVIGALIDGITANAPALADAAVQVCTVLTEGFFEVTADLIELGAALLTALAESIMAQLPAMTETVQRIITRLTDALVTGIPQLTEAAVSLLSALVETLLKPDTLTALLDAGLQIVAALVQGILSSIPALIEAASTLITNAADFLTGSIPVILNAAVQLFSGITAAIPQIIAALAKELPRITKTIGALFPQIVREIGKALPSVIKAVTDALPVIASALAAALPEIITGITEMLVSSTPELLNAAITLLMSLIDAIPVITDALIGQMPSIILAVTSALIQAAPQIAEAALTMFLAIVQAIPEVVGKLAEGILQLHETAREAVQSMFSGIAQMFMNWLSGILSTAKQGASDLVSGAMEFLDTLPERIGYMLGQAIGHIAQWCIEAPEKAKAAASEFLNNVVTFFTELPERAKEWLDRSIERVAEWAVGLAEKGKAAASDLVMTVTEGVKELPGKMLETGRQLIGGLWDGIKEAGASLKEKWSEFTGGFMDGVKSAFGIHSPSKLMHDEVGEYLALGIGEGFADEAAQIGQRITQTVSGWTITLAKDVQSAAQRVTDGASALFGKLPVNLQKPLTDAGNALSAWASSAAETARKAGQEFLAATQKYLSMLPGDTGKQLAETLTRAADYAANLIRTGQESAHEFLSKTMDFLHRLPDMTQEELTDTLNRVIRWGADLVRRGIEAAQSLVSGIVDAVASLPDTMAGIGANLVSGLWNGITGMGGWLRDQISGFAGGIIDDFKETFGIASPSKVMRDSVGKYIAQGLGVGFSEEIPQIGKDALAAFGALQLPVIRFDANVDAIFPESMEALRAEIEPLSVKIEKTELPEILPEMPDFEVPELTIPNIEIPEIEAPHIEVPEAEAIEITTPGIELPELKMPELPDIDAQQIELILPEIPELKCEIPELPKLEVRAAKLPEPEAVRLMQTPQTVQPFLAPSPTSEITNNYNTYNTTNTRTGQTPPVINVHVHVDAEMDGDRIAEKVAERVDILQGEAVTFDERGTAH